jgi:hypothetical protein
MKRYLKILLGTLTLLAVVALSIKVEPLSERTPKKFDPTEHVARFWAEELPTLLASDRVVDADLFREELKHNRRFLIERYGLTLGIGAPYSLLLGGEFEVVEVGEELTTLRTAAQTELAMRTAYIFGNTVREATALFSIDDYENTMDFNLVSSELNRRIQQEVISPQREALVEGARLQVVGALDLPQEGLPKGRFELIPLTLKTL